MDKNHLLGQDADPWNCGIALFFRFGADGTRPEGAASES